MPHDHKYFLRIPFLLLLALMWSVGVVWAAIEEQPSPLPRNRLAIVIGNSNYQSTRLEHLANAANDATKLAESLKRLNFDVLIQTDLSAEGFAKLFRDADAKLAATSSVLIFYAGHGVQLQGENYLLPVDTPDPESMEKLSARAVKLNDVIARFASRDRQTFVFLDACRNNPLGSGANTGNGLAQVEVGENTFIAFATQPGNVTVDGSGDNSPFTTALLKNVEIPGLSISDMMIRVRNETEALTVGRQVPWDQSNLREQFYFTEQQVLDPAQLSASLSRILSDPVAKQKLQLELASNDLQTAVLIVGQTLRSVEIPAQAKAAQAQTGTQVASLSPKAIEGARQSVVSGLETLIVGTSAGETDDAKATDLARSIQTELRRLGCYRMTVDGDWGKGSIRALTDYYRNTKQAMATSDPTVELLGDLFLRSGRICKQPVIVKKVKPPRVAADESRGRASKAATGNRKAMGRSQTRSRPAAPPPDISGGIGIGGVF
ncbi:Caspase domain-containing protein [Mesorhizobium albiziae]|uniref:Caspase domain-containing protein n=1 Tax=Neomesorhizobium albiziae TaxID=335020 RepID=A0A1I4EA26_9HYPH|nr:caspase family protein [Mesorhizobium albiziae]GLS31139.1 peptidase C14 [Mesorhizobium albiziae]SFL02664.1 Caspase domain-containing protein [Mesorhizobium albiziae]